ELCDYNSRAAVIHVFVEGGRMLTAEGCAGRLARVRRLMQARRWDALVIVQSGTVNCIERVLVPNAHPVVLWIEPEGAPLLVTDAGSETVQAERAPFDSYSPRRPIDLPWREALGELDRRLQGRQTPGTIAVEKFAAPAALIEVIEQRFPGCSVADAGPDLRRFRRIKDPDEVQVFRRLAAIAEAGAGWETC